MPSPPNRISGVPLQYPAAVSARYQAKLDRAIRRMTREVMRDLKRFFKSDTATEHFAEDASISSQARILTNALMQKYDDFFQDFAKEAAWTFVREIDRTSKVAVNANLRELSKSLTIKASDVVTGGVKEALSASVTENVGLIKSISSQYLTQVQGAVMRSITNEQGLAYLIPFLEKQEGVTRRRAELISLDQTRKAYQSLNSQRLQDAGVTEYVWVHSRSGLHPRQFHKNELSGKTFKWSEPPIADEATGERAHPGGLVNCRCFAKPVISFARRK